MRADSQELGCSSRPGKSAHKEDGALQCGRKRFQIAIRWYHQTAELADHEPALEAPQRFCNHLGSATSGSGRDHLHIDAIFEEQTGLRLHPAHPLVVVSDWQNDDGATGVCRPAIT